MRNEKTNARRQPGESALHTTHGNYSSISAAVDKLRNAFENKRFCDLEVADLLLLERRRILSHETASRLMKEASHG